MYLNLVGPRDLALVLDVPCVLFCTTSPEWRIVSKNEVACYRLARYTGTVLRTLVRGGGGGGPPQAPPSKLNVGAGSGFHSRTASSYSD